MLRSLKELTGYIILATDGEIGSIHDFYLTIRLGPSVISSSTLALASGPAGVLSPTAFNQHSGRHEIPSLVTQDQVKNSPDIDSISRLTPTGNRLIYLL